MKSLGNVTIWLFYSLIFVIVVLPLGMLIRFLWDPMHLRQGSTTSYFRLLAPPGGAGSTLAAANEDSVILARNPIDD